MKNRTFSAKWNNYEWQLDQNMTLERATRLICCWRRNSRQASNHNKWLFERIGLHAFRVAIPDYPDEVHYLRWEA